MNHINYYLNNFDLSFNSLFHEQLFFIDRKKMPVEWIGLEKSTLGFG